MTNVTKLYCIVFICSISLCLRLLAHSDTSSQQTIPPDYFRESFVRDFSEVVPTTVRSFLETEFGSLTARLCCQSYVRQSDIMNAAAALRGPSGTQMAQTEVCTCT